MIATMDSDKIKTVGKRNRPATPADCLRRAQRLQQYADAINPYPHPRGFVFKARTYEEYEAWRRNQPNPRLW